MEDLMKALARAKPFTPEVDHERMERDLAEIIVLPHEEKPRYRVVKRFAPLLVIGAVIALVVVLLPSPPEPVQPAAPPRWWHVLTQVRSMMIVGDPAKPYAADIMSKTDRWVSSTSEVTVLQKDGSVRAVQLTAERDEWEAAGRPEFVPVVGGTTKVHIGPMKPAVRRNTVSGFQMSAHSEARFDSLDSLPADPGKLRTALEKIVGSDTYRLATLAIELISSNLRPDQRVAAFDVLKSLDGARSLDDGMVRGEYVGPGVAVPRPSGFQFTGLETQLFLSQETGLPVLRQDVLTTPQYGMPAGYPVLLEEYLLLEEVDWEPIVPQDVPVNAPVESPIIER